jgi:hypothetical protein
MAGETEIVRYIGVQSQLKIYLGSLFFIRYIGVYVLFSSPIQNPETTTAESRSKAGDYYLFRYNIMKTV